jgi:chromosome segregation ATPase
MPKKKSTTTQVEDVPHETVQTNGTPGLPAVIITEEQVIASEIQKFKLSDAAISDLKNQYENLTIAGPEDKTGYSAVKSAWNEVRSVRTGLEKTGLDLRRRFNVITKGIQKEEDRLTGEVSQLETTLHARWKKIDDDKLAAELERNRQAEEALMNRINQLTDAGMTQQDGYYQVGGTVTVDVGTLRQMSDDRFNEFLKAVNTRKSELDALAKEQAGRIAEAEAKYKQERENFEREQAEFRQQQAELQRQKLEAQEIIRGARIDQVKALGMTVIGQDFVFADGEYSVRHGVETIVSLDQYWLVM